MRTAALRILLAAGVTLSLAGEALAEDARALLDALNADLLGHDSATLTLERWCAARHLATPARVVAERVKGVDKPPTDAQRRLLGAAADEPVRYRRVRLRCGDHVLSEADNWYRPNLLTPEMNRLLDETDTPFGKAVQPLGFRRKTLSAEVVWKGGAAKPADHVIEHQAVLLLPDGAPFSEVVESYTGEVLAEGR